MAKVAEPEEEHQPAAQRLARAPRDRGRGPGGMEGARPQRDDQAAGVGPVPRVHRPAAGQVGRRLPARLDRRLRRRDQLPRALDVRLGQQLDELLQQESTSSSRRLARRRTTPRATSSTRSSRRTCSARTAPCRSRRSTGTRTPSSSRSRSGTRSTEPARPDRPDQVEVARGAPARTCTRAGRSAPRPLPFVKPPAG